MRNLSVATAVLALAFAVAPTWAQPEPVVPNTPQAVAQAFLNALPALALAPGGEAEKQIAAMLVQPEALRAVHEGAIILNLLYALAGAQAQPPVRMGERDALVPMVTPPLRVVVVVADGTWKIDPVPTGKALPPALQALWADRGEASPPEHPETAGAGGPAPPAEGPPPPAPTPAPAPPPAPETATGDPRETVIQALETLRAWGLGPAEPDPGLAGLVVNPPEHLEGGPLEGVVMIYTVWALCGAEALAPEIPLQNPCLVPVATPRINLALALVEGQWKVDLQASWEQVPQLIRASFDRQRRQAVAATCLSNLKQLTLAALMYATDHDGCLPGADKWTDQLLPYFKAEQLLRCPAAPDLECAYAMNAELSGARLDDLANPQGVALFFEAEVRKRNAIGGAAEVCDPARHAGRNAFAFADGHVQLLGVIPSFTPEWKQ